MNDVENVTKELSEAAFLHTDLIAVGHDGGRNFRMAGLGSVTLISYKNKQYAITCEHVVHNCSLFFSGAGKGDTPSINEKDILRCKNLKLITTCELHDIAILSGYNPDSKTKKSFYPLEESDSITFESLSKNLGTLCLFDGVWGKYTQKGPWNDILYFDTCYVSAWSGIADVKENEIIVDFAAKEITEKRTDVFPKLAEVEATGGTLDFSGCSGCGLWVKFMSKPVLIGILLGRAICDVKTQHLIRFTPIWKIKEILGKI